MKRIVITVTTDISYDQRVQKIAQSLHDFGYQVQVIGRKKANSKGIDSEFKTRLINCFFSRSILFYAEYNVRLFFILLFSRLDVICSCDLDTLLAGGFVSKLRNKKLVFDAHEYFEESIEIIGNKKVQKTWEMIARICIPWTQDRYTVSESLAKIFKQKYSFDFELIRNLPILLQIENPITRDKIIWYQGAVNEGRGLDQVIDWMQNLDSYALHIAGDGDMVDQLKEKTRALHLENRVIFYGRLDYQQLVDNARSAFVGLDLLESKSPSYYYSLSNKTFDYMHSGLPSIQMNFPEYLKIQEEFRTGILLKKLDKQNFLNAIQQLEDENFYNQCVLECKRAAIIYNWDLEAIKLKEIYSKLCS
ncbi:MAG: glycosyltransferase [Saprospiraceae bacterium]|nr:glycosyltransferase [Saprospiraceae bacterium]